MAKRTPKNPLGFPTDGLDGPVPAAPRSTSTRTVLTPAAVRAQKRRAALQKLFHNHPKG